MMDCVQKLCVMCVCVCAAINGRLSSQSDLWSCGITAIEMAEGAPRECQLLLISAICDWFNPMNSY